MLLLSIPNIITINTNNIKVNTLKETNPQNNSKKILNTNDNSSDNKHTLNINNPEPMIIDRTEPNKRKDNQVSTEINLDQSAPKKQKVGEPKWDLKVPADTKIIINEKVKGLTAEVLYVNNFLNVTEQSELMLEVETLIALGLFEQEKNLFNGQWVDAPRKGYVCGGPRLFVLLQCKNA